MNDLNSLDALLKAPFVIDNDIWHCLIKRNKKSLKAFEHLAALLKNIYKTLAFNCHDKVYFLNVSQSKIKRLKVEIELIDENRFFIKVSEDKNTDLEYN